MVKETIIILAHEDKTSKGNPPKDYTRFKCQYENNGIKWVSCFNTEVIQMLKEHEGRPVSVEIVNPNGSEFYNIRKFYGAVPATTKQLDNAIESTDKLIKETVETIKPEEFVKEKSENKKTFQPTTMYVAYAKDIFCTIRGGIDNPSIPKEFDEELMQRSIELIKQAKQEFEF